MRCRILSATIGPVKDSKTSCRASRLAAAGGDALLDALGDHIFRLSGLLVADCHVPRRERDGDMLAAEVEMLTVALD